MATEIERKFLVAHDGWRKQVERHIDIRQAYIATTENTSVRVRIADDKAFLTIKSAGPALSRHEFEYAIPLDDALTLIGMRHDRLIKKRRHIVPVDGSRWEVDVFGGEFEGLTVAEIELEDEQAHVERPDWLGAEVTDDPHYGNAHLAAHGMPPRS